MQRATLAAKSVILLTCSLCWISTVQAAGPKPSAKADLTMAQGMRAFVQMADLQAAGAQLEAAITANPKSWEAFYNLRHARDGG